MKYPPELSYEGLEVGSTEYVRVANRRYYFRNTEKEKKRSKKWREQNQEKHKSWVEKNKERIRANGRKAEYNITSEQYEQKKKEQNHRCAICRVKVDLLVVDHDHKCCPRKKGPNRKTCGKCNRGLLCRSCNTLIGLAKESSKILKSAIKYLKEYN